MNAQIKKALAFILTLFLFASTLFTSCNDNTVTTPMESPSVSEESSPAPSDQAPTPSPSDNYTDLPVVECEHKEIAEDYSYLKVLDCFSKADLFTLTFSEEDSAVLAKILSEGRWVKGDLDLEGQWYIRALQPQDNEAPRYMHYNDQGIFFVFIFHFIISENTDFEIIHLVLTDRQRDIVNGILAKYEEQPTPLPDPADPQAVLAYIEEKKGSQSGRTDFADPAAIEKISLDTPYESLAELIGTHHFSFKNSYAGYSAYPCYPEFFVLSDGRILELKIETDLNERGNTIYRTIIGKRLLTIAEFDKEYLTRFTENTDENVVRLRKGMPLLYSLHTLAGTPFERDGLGFMADFSRNDALDPALIDQINEGMYAPEVYSILGSPHVSHRQHDNIYNGARAWYALSDGRILQVFYQIAETEEQEQSALAAEYGLSQKAVYYTVKSINVYEESFFLDYYLYVCQIYPWRGLQW